MNILIIGSGGREHALADAFTRSPQIHKLVVSPGNAGIAGRHHCKRLDSKEEILRFCRETLIDFVFIGGEQPVADGLSDFLRSEGIRVIAPSQAAGRIETSKAFSKSLMQRYNIPTARFVQVYNADDARASLESFGYPVVLKSSGLAAGKGVCIAENEIEAEEAITYLFKIPGEEGLIIEEYLVGWEVSLFALCDGEHYQSTIFSQDHKQLYDNDCGPNTGGMGAFAPVPEAEAYRAQIEKEIIEPTLAAMRQEGCPFAGVLYIGLMITREGPKVLEFNCRWGDPEAEVVLPLLMTDFIEICKAIDAKEMDKIELAWSEKTAVTVVLASQGYPAQPLKGNRITIGAATDSTVFYAGVAHSEAGLVTAGGRVIMLTALGEDLLDARDRAYRALETINFEGKYFRRDIGLRSNSLL